MNWNLLKEEEIENMNKAVIEQANLALKPEDKMVFDVIKKEALAEATANQSYEYCQTLGEAIYVLARSIAQGHPFADGNKRTTSMAVMEFLKRNGEHEGTIPDQELQELIGQLADMDPIEKEDFLEELHRITMGTIQ